MFFFNISDELIYTSIAFYRLYCTELNFWCLPYFFTRKPRPQNTEAPQECGVVYPVLSRVLFKCSFVWCIFLHLKKYFKNIRNGRCMWPLASSEIPINCTMEIVFTLRSDFRSSMYSSMRSSRIIVYRGIDFNHSLLDLYS